MIEVGEYIRTEEGFIFKVTGIEHDEDWKDNWLKGDQEYLGDWEDYVKKHSKNIIDLIEVGDFVNGKRVNNTYLDGATHYIKIGKYDGTRTYEEDIKSIVTKEQFTNIEYIVED